MNHRYSGLVVDPWMAFVVVYGVFTDLPLRSPTSHVKPDNLHVDSPAYRKPYSFGCKAGKKIVCHHLLSC